MRLAAARVAPASQTLHIPNWCGCTTEYFPVYANSVVAE
jgi:hypothetical protein